MLFEEIASSDGIVEYNSVDQLIIYILNPKDRKKKTEYLLEFENKVMRMFQRILEFQNSFIV